METMLRASEVASLIGCDPRSVRRKAAAGKIEARQVLNDLNRPEYLIPLEALEPHIQQRYFDQMKASLPTPPAEVRPGRKASKPLDNYTIDKREQIVFWMRAVEEWQDYRKRYPGCKAEADEKFCALRAIADPEHPFSIDTLYRRWKSIEANDLDGLIDKRGKWKKGKSTIDETVWQMFLYFFLDERQHPIKRCYEYTKTWVRKDFPDLFTTIPSYTTFTRRIKSDIPEGVKVLGREGEKAFRDRCAPYIRRTYRYMASNEWWIADNHTFDVITQGENGQRHRLYLTAFFDARSGIFTGCYVTTAPSSQSTEFPEMYEHLDKLDTLLHRERGNAQAPRHRHSEAGL